jgi:hypothetical protein
LPAHANHAPARGCPKKLSLVSTKAEDNREYNEEARVVLNLVEKHRFSFENFDSRFYPNSAEDTVEDEDDR